MSQKKAEYTHGFEKIYNYETIDLKSIRPMAAPKVEELTEEEEPMRTKHFGYSQLFFRFDSLTLSVDSFILGEPAAVLKLPSQLKEVLQKQSIRTIQDLLALDLYSFCRQHGVGQGHIDELLRAVAKYTKGVQLYSVKRVNYGALIRSATDQVDQRKLAAFLESLGMTGLVPLSVTDHAEVKRLTEYERKKWIADALEMMQQEPTFSKLKRAYKSVVQSLVIPWMMKQGGLITLEELQERLQGIGEGEVSAEAFLKFVEVVNEDGNYLPCFSTGLYTYSHTACMELEELKTRVLGYFYNDRVCYELEELKSYVCRESAKNWEFIDDSFLTALIMKDPEFSLFRVETDEKIRVKYLPQLL